MKIASRFTIAAMLLLTSASAFARPVGARRHDNGARDRAPQGHVHTVVAHR